VQAMKQLICNEKLDYNRKKNLEKELFQDFLEHVGIQLGIDEWIQCEQPDILCKTNNGEIVGIEIFEYMAGAKTKNGSSLRQDENTEFEITNKIQEKIIGKYSGPIICQYSFPRNIVDLLKGSKSNVRIFSENLFAKISPLIEGGKGKDLDFSAEEICEYDLDDYITSLSINQSIGDSNLIVVQHSIAGWSGFDESAFISTIKKKEKKSESYLKKCDKCWLLGVSHGPYISSTVLFKELPRINRSTVFEKIYFSMYGQGSRQIM
jgi:hypothetical protein